MCPGPIVVLDVLQQDPAKVPFADHDEVVKTFPSNRADHPLGIRVLPWRARSNDGLLDVQHPGLMRKSFSIDLVSVPNQIPGPLLQAVRLEELPRRPFRGRMLRDVEMHQRRACASSSYSLCSLTMPARRPLQRDRAPYRPLDRPADRGRFPL